MAMTKIEPFKVERWFDDHEPWAKYNLAETCVASVSTTDLQTLSGQPETPVVQLGTKLVYGAIRGSETLRTRVASLYSPDLAYILPPSNVLIAAGGINANFLVLYTLLSRGDHVICQHPTYQQLYSVPQSLGAKVSLWKTSPENKWQLSIEELKGMIQKETKMIIINNPQNPTGAAISEELLHQIRDVAREHNLILFADEVYRPLFHSTSFGTPPSVASLGYERTVATGSMSKAFSLAGIRIGWVVSRSSEIIEACAAARDYTNIAVSQIDDQIASFALHRNCVHPLLKRNMELARTNLEILSGFIAEHKDICEWVRPQAGTIAFVKFARNGHPVDDVRFCEELQRQLGVMFCPGNACFAEHGEFKGYLRIGYACDTDELKKGLEKVEEFLKTKFLDIPLV